MNFSQKVSKHVSENAGGIAACFTSLVVCMGVVAAFSSAGGSEENNVTTPKPSTPEIMAPQ